MTETSTLTERADDPEMLEVSSLREYLEAVFAFAQQDEVLFRGQRRGSWDLKPSLARARLRLQSSHLELESQLMTQFQRQYIPHLKSELLKDEWDVLAVAQHHGLYTRLLDWSMNPLAALWFAVRNPPEDNDPAVVFMFEPHSEDYAAAERASSPYTVNRTLFFQPSYLDARIVAQAGWFSVHAWNEGDGGFYRLDQLARYSGRIKRIHIPAEHVWKLRNACDRLGTNDVTLFPDLDGLCRHLNWYHTLYADED